MHLTMTMAPGQGDPTSFMSSLRLIDQDDRMLKVLDLCRPWEAQHSVKLPPSICFLHILGGKEESRLQLSNISNPKALMCKGKVLKKMHGLQLSLDRK